MAARVFLTPEFSAGRTLQRFMSISPELCHESLHEVVAVADARAIGEAKLFISVHTMQSEPGNIRTDLSLGGGPLEDMGIYCLNAARCIFKAEPEPSGHEGMHDVRIIDALRKSYTAV